MEGDGQNVNQNAPAPEQTTGQPGGGDAAPQQDPQQGDRARPEGGGFAVPEGKRLVDQQEFERLSRRSQQFDGMKTFYEKAKQYGLGDEGALDKHGPIIQEFGRRGVDPQTLSRLLNGAPEDGPGGREGGEDRGLSREDLEQMTERQVRDVMAKERHRESLASMYDSIDGIVDRVVGDGGSEAEKSLFRDAARGYLANIDNRETYGDGPLEGEFKPLDKGGLSKLEAALRETRKQLGAASAARLGDAANRSPSASRPAANQSGGQGSPNQHTKAGPKKLPGRDEILAHLERKHQQRGGEPVAQ